MYIYPSVFLDIQTCCYAVNEGTETHGNIRMMSLCFPGWTNMSRIYSK